MTCASSSFSPLAGVVITGSFLADEGLDVGVEDFGVVEVDFDAPSTDKNFVLMRLYQVLADSSAQVRLS